MKRYYSHYTFIYPDIYLKNHIVEMDDEGNIDRFFIFEKEIEKTEFYSGLLVFLPEISTVDKGFIDNLKNEFCKRYSDLDLQLSVEICLLKPKT